MSDFSQKIYHLVDQIPKGRVTTYKALGDAIGTKAYRAIGQALKHNPNAPHTPCHRVVASDGSIGGFMGQTKGKNILQKINLLASEGIKITGKKVVDFEKKKYLWT